jgi:5-keto 4-deoxyuronate isomerase
MPTAHMTLTCTLWFSCHKNLTPPPSQDGLYWLNSLVVFPSHSIKITKQILLRMSVHTPLPTTKVLSSSDLNQVLCCVKTGRSTSNNAYFWYWTGSGCQPPLCQETLMVTVLAQPQKLHTRQIEWMTYAGMQEQGTKFHSTTKKSETLGISEIYSECGMDGKGWRRVLCFYLL